jgi:hypothetical protein
MQQQASRQAMTEALEPRRLMSFSAAATTLVAEPLGVQVPAVHLAFQVAQAVRAPTSTIAMFDYDPKPVAPWEFNNGWPEKHNLGDDPRGR